MLTATMMVLGLAACGATDTKDGAGDTSAAGSGSSGDLIKVGIINNDPNESGYRTANDKDMKNMFLGKKTCTNSRRQWHVLSVNICL